MSTMAEEWAKFERMVLASEGLSQKMLTNNRVMFYAGAQSAVLSIIQTFRSSNANMGVCETKFDSLCGECLAYLLTNVGDPADAASEN